MVKRKNTGKVRIDKNPAACLAAVDSMIVRGKV